MLSAHPERAAWTAHLDRQGISRLEVHPDPVEIATEGALWGSIHAHGHIFKRRTGFVTLDRLLGCLHGRKDELLPVRLRPDITLHTNGSENDIRRHVTKRQVSGGTWPEPDRLARDTFLGLMKTCQKLGFPFFDYLGARLLVPGTAAIVPLPKLVIAANP